MPRTVLYLSAFLFVCNLSFSGEPAPKPLFRDFMGVNGHTVQFKPELYKPCCRLVRDYHPIDWDFGEDTSYATTFPMARNRVDWKLIYGGWKKAGFITDVCGMFDNIKIEKWKDMQKDAHAYGLAFAKYFGPSGQNIVTSFEVGNEPGKYKDDAYRKLFEAMAKGVREGDPKMTILTSNVVAGKSHDYAKSLACFEGLNELFDVINIHTYAQAEPWPTFKRSYPEDPKIPYLKEVRDVVAWRDSKAPGKGIWITEFGWDASTQPAPKTGAFSKWIGNTEEQQAQWLCRSFMLFANMPVDRAYIYFFNDSDEPQMHGSSGLTRNWKPKPCYHAVAHQFKTLGDYRFSKVLLEKAGEVYAYEFTHETDAAKKIWAVWSPTGSKREGEVTLPLGGLRAVKAEQMPLAAGDAPVVEIKKQDDNIVVPAREVPIYIWIEK